METKCLKCFFFLLFIHLDAVSCIGSVCVSVTQTRYCCFIFHFIYYITTAKYIINGTTGCRSFYTQINTIKLKCDAVMLSRNAPEHELCFTDFTHQSLFIGFTGKPLHDLKSGLAHIITLPQSLVETLIIERRRVHFSPVNM